MSHFLEDLAAVAGSSNDNNNSHNGIIPLADLRNIADKIQGPKCAECGEGPQASAHHNFVATDHGIESMVGIASAATKRARGT